MTDHILFNYELDGKGGGHPLILPKTSGKLPKKSLTWVHLDVLHPGTKKWLNKEMSFLDPLIIEALVEKETRPKVIIKGSGLLVVLRCMNLNKDHQPEDMVSIRMWIDKNHIITLQKRPVKTVSKITDDLKEGRGPKNSGEFLCTLVSDIFEVVDPFLDNLDEKTEDIEERVWDSLTPDLREDIANLRKKVILLRRYMTPQREAIRALSLSEDFRWLDNFHRGVLQGYYQTILRHVEDLDEIKERIQIIADEVVNLLSDRLNKNMYFISIIAAIFLPLSFLTGLFGVNLKGIPGATSEAAFLYLCGILTLVVLIQVWIFKKLNLLEVK